MRLLLIFFLALPLLPAWPLGIPWARLFLSGAGIFWLVRAAKRKSIPLPLTPPVSALFAFVCFATLSLLWSPLPEMAIRKALVLWTVVPLLFFVPSSFIERQRLLRVFVFGSFLSACFGILFWSLQFLLGSQAVAGSVLLLNPFFFGHAAADTIQTFPSWYVGIRGHDLLRAFLPFPDPHTAALFWGMGLGASLTPRLLGGFWRFTPLVLVGALLATFSRGAYIMLIVLGVFFLFQKRKLFALVLLVLLALFFSATPFIADRFSSIRTLDEGSIGGRLELWSTAWNSFVERPVFGSGLGGFAYDADPVAGSRDPVNAHSTYLEVAAELGVIGLALWSFVVILGFLYARRGGRETMGIAAGILAFTVHTLFEIDLYSPPNLAALFLLLALSGETQTTKSQTQNQNTKSIFNAQNPKTV